MTITVKSSASVNAPLALFPPKKATLPSQPLFVTVADIVDHLYYKSPRLLPQESILFSLPQGNPRICPGGKNSSLSRYVRHKETSSLKREGRFFRRPVLFYVPFMTPLPSKGRLAARFIPLFSNSQKNLHFSLFISQGLNRTESSASPGGINPG